MRRSIPDSLPGAPAWLSGASRVTRQTSRTILILSLITLAAFANANWDDLLPNTPQDQKPALVKDLPPAQTQGQLPAPDPENERLLLRIMRADEQELNGAHVSLRGKVVATYKGYTMTADSVEGDRRTQVFTLSKNARLEGEGVLVLAKSITIDYKRRTFSFIEGDSTIPPSKLKGNTTGNIYLRGATGSGDARREELGPTSFTTCDYDDPHYSLDARRATIVVDRYALLRDVKFRVLGHTLFTLPFFYLPLSREESRLTPEFGQTEDEGYYAKLKYFTPVKGDSFLITRLDFMSKLGEGLGQVYRYNTNRAQGAISAYTLLGDRRTLTVNANHNQPLGKGSLSVDGTYQRNNYLTAPDSSILSTRAQYTTPLGLGNLRLAFQRGSSETAGFVSNNQNISFGHQGNWGRGLATSLGLNFTENDSSSLGAVTNKSERLDARFNATQQSPAFDAQLDYQRAIPVGTVTNFFTGSDRTPQFTLATNIGRLTGNRISPERLSLKFEAGDLRDVTESSVTRYSMEAISRYNTHKGRLSLSGGGRFVQGLYSDDTAQYVLNYDDRLSYEYGQGSTVGINYNRLAQFGYTPLAMDQTGRADNFNLDWQHMASITFRLGLTTGYDVYQSSQSNAPWQSVGITANYDRGVNSRYVGTFLYDTFSNAWSSLRLDGAFRVLGADCTAGVRYDGLRSTFAGANLQIRGFQTGKVTADAYFGYNGYTKQLEVQQFRFIYDLHCMEALLQVSNTTVGFRPGQTIGFYIRIKALPQTNNFGFGSRGQQYFGTGSAGL